MESALDRKKRREDNEAEEEGTFSLKKWNVLSKRIKEAVKSKEEKQADDLKEYSNMVYFELSTFVKFFINLQVPFEMANHLLQDAVERFVQDKEKAHNLYTELSSGQKNERLFRNGEITRWR